MGFIFKLEALLKQRSREKEQAQSAYAKAQRNVNEKMKEIDCVYTTMQNTREEGVRVSVNGTSQHGFYSMSESYLVGAKTKVEMLKAEARELMIIAEDKHEALVEVTRDFKIIEKLKEKRKKEYQLALKKRREKATEELNIMRFKRAKNAGI